MDEKICLDSDVLIELERGNLEVKRILELKKETATLSTTPINVFELWFGFKNKEEIFLLIEDLFIYNFDKNAAKVAGDIKRTLKKEGEDIEIRDLFIAAICIKNNLKLFTFNKKHFERLMRFGLILFEL